MTAHGSIPVFVVHIRRVNAAPSSRRKMGADGDSIIAFLLASEERKRAHRCPRAARALASTVAPIPERMARRCIESQVTGS